MGAKRENTMDMKTATLKVDTRAGTRENGLAARLEYMKVGHSGNESAIEMAAHSVDSRAAKMEYG